ncbi:hypothetical protein P775_00510 [Puniceibacterium antarcticum]|uniref:NADPH-dependent FMN reductase-like domain-containing protein n=1 Tax=Puniceibacterium antarcticum TaxID=1206336 RepID=A0A2G8RLQ0_9RHOB|nr:FMN reductase [Puniceibacterium antarcticum]PIL22198.1 hypothetical protein P775_00510 [Puniceibacterium antarcticum]
MSVSVVGIAGSFSQPSRTRELVAQGTERAALLTNGTARVFDMIDFGPSLGAALRADELDANAAAILERILTADALVVGSPVYKGSYTGLFKHLFDLIPPEALKEKPILLTATGGGYRHALVIEHQLRPLFGFFEAATVPTGIYASGEDFPDGVNLSETLEARLTDGVAQLVARVPVQLTERPVPAFAD